MTRMAPLLRWRKRGNVSAPSPPTFYYRRDTLRSIALRLNTRSRKTLGYRTPAATLAETVASTG